MIGTPIKWKEHQSWININQSPFCSGAPNHDGIQALYRWGVNTQAGQQTTKTCRGQTFQKSDLGPVLFWPVATASCLPLFAVIPIQSGSDALSKMQTWLPHTHSCLSDRLFYFLRVYASPAVEEAFRQCLFEYMYKLPRTTHIVFHTHTTAFSDCPFFSLGVYVSRGVEEAFRRCLSLENYTRYTVVSCSL